MGNQNHYPDDYTDFHMNSHLERIQEADAEENEQLHPKLIEAKAPKEPEHQRRMCFCKDDDAHWYLIPSSLLGRFDELLLFEDSEKFNDEFSKHRIGCSPTHYTFLDPILG